MRRNYGAYSSSCQVGADGPDCSLCAMAVEGGVLDLVFLATSFQERKALFDGWGIIGGTLTNPNRLQCKVLS